MENGVKLKIIQKEKKWENDLLFNNQYLKTKIKSYNSSHHKF